MGRPLWLVEASLPCSIALQASSPRQVPLQISSKTPAHHQEQSSKLRLDCHAVVTSNIKPCN